MFTVLAPFGNVGADRHETGRSGKVRNAKLWARLEAFRFDSANDTSSLSDQLVAAESWSATYAARVVEEYRRFLYLSQVLPGQAAPSEPIDRAWRLHADFGDAYWNGLCGRTLGQVLKPEAPECEGGIRRHPHQYAETVAAYTAEFGAPPPGDIWEGAEELVDRSGGAGKAALAAFGTAVVFLVLGLVLLTRSTDRDAATALLVLSAVALVVALWEWLFPRSERRIGRQRQKFGSSGSGDLQGYDFDRASGDGGDGGGD